METVLLIIGGLFTGLVTGITGSSGVLVVVPIIVIFFGVSIQDAIGTSLLSDVIASIPIAYIYYKNGNTNIGASIWLAIGAIVGAQLGAHQAALLSGPLLVTFLSIFMIGLGVKMWHSGIKHTASHPAWEMPGFFKRPAARAILLFALGVIIGLFTGFFGAGGGLLVFMVVYFVLRFPLKVAIGTSTLIMIITAFSASVGYASNETMNISQGLILGFSAAVGGALSARIANYVSDDTLAKGIGSVFFIFGLLMIFFKLVS